MYVIRRKRRITGSDTDLEKGIMKFLQELGDPANETREDLATTKEVIGGFLEREGRFQWGPVSITKSRK